jgi:hypothetical protein
LAILGNLSTLWNPCLMHRFGVAFIHQLYWNGDSNGYLSVE